MKKFLVALCLMIALSAGTAMADTLSFNGIAAPGNTWSAGGFTLGSTLTATTSGFVTVSGTPSGGFIVSPGSVFTFTTGGLLAGGSGGAIYSGGGSISACTIFGCFTGSFTGGTFLDSGSTTYSFSAPFVVGSVSPSLLLALGISNPATLLEGSLSATLNKSGSMGTIGATLNQVPEPASMALLGTGMLGLGSFVRRKLSL